MRRLSGQNWIAWLACAAVCAWAVYAAWDTLLTPDPGSGAMLLVGKVAVALFPILFVIPAALIITRQPRNMIGRLMMALAVVGVLSDAANRYLTSLQEAPTATLPILLMYWFNNWSWMALITLLMLILLRFPNGSPLTPRWRRVEYLAYGMAAFFVIISADTRKFGEDSRKFGLEEIQWDLPNPLQFLSEEAIQIILIPWMLMLILLTVFSLSSLAARYRRASEVGRVQMKWLLYACTLFGMVYVFLLVVNSYNSLQALRDFAYLVFMLAVMTIPTAIGVAILRHRLFDIDVIIRMTLIYTLVTGLLGLAYASGVVLFQQGFHLLTGQVSDFAIVLTTLLTAALFQPLRQRVQAVIDRRFFRQKYNAEQAIAEFAAASRGGHDLDLLTAMLEEVVQTNLQPTQVHLQLRPDQGDMRSERDQ